jgi:hypothetical protein
MKRYLLFCILAMVVILPPAFARADPFTFTLQGNSEYQSNGDYVFNITSITASSDSAHPGSFTVENGQLVIDPSLASIAASGTLSKPRTLTEYGFLGGDIGSMTSNINNGTGTISGIGLGVMNETVMRTFFPSLGPKTISVFTFDGTFTNGNGSYTLQSKVPEPMSILLMGSGLLGWVTFRRKQFFKNRKAMA